MKKMISAILIVIAVVACKEKPKTARLEIPINQRIADLVRDAKAANDENRKASLYGEAAELLTDKGDYKEAMTIARLGERANPTQRQCLTAIAEVELAEGKVAEATLTIKDALQKHPNHGRAHYVQGNLSASAGDLVGASKSYGLAEKNGFKDARVLLNTGMVYIKAKQSTNALAAYSRAIAAYPELPEAYLGAGIAARESNKKSDAKKYFEKYLALAPHASQADRVRLWLKKL